MADVVKILLAVVVATIATTAVLVLGLFHQGAINATQLCQIMARTIKTGDQRLGMPGTAGYAYYSTHPDELADGHRANRELLRELPCPTRGVGSAR